jgi:hypothetical protein
MKLVTLTLCGFIFISPAVAQSTNCRPLPAGGYHCSDGLRATPYPDGGLLFNDGTRSRPQPGGGFEIDTSNTIREPVSRPGRICIKDIYGQCR